MILWTFCVGLFFFSCPYICVLIYDIQVFNLLNRPWHALTEFVGWMFWIDLFCKNVSLFCIKMSVFAFWNFMSSNLSWVCYVVISGVRYVTSLCGGLTLNPSAETEDLQSSAAAGKRPCHVFSRGYSLCAPHGPGLFWCTSRNGKPADIAALFQLNNCNICYLSSHHCVTFNFC